MGSSLLSILLYERVSRGKYLFYTECRSGLFVQNPRPLLTLANSKNNKRSSTNPSATFTTCCIFFSNHMICCWCLSVSRCRRSVVLPSLTLSSLSCLRTSISSINSSRSLARFQVTVSRSFSNFPSCFFKRPSSKSSLSPVCVCVCVCVCGCCCI